MTIALSDILNKKQVDNRLTVLESASNNITITTTVADETARLALDVSGPEYVNGNAIIFQGNSSNGYLIFLLTDKANSTPADRYTALPYPVSSGSGDKYKTLTTTTINASAGSVSLAPITITVDAGLSYTNGQGIVIAVNPNLDSKFLATVQTYNIATGSMDVVLYRYLAGATSGLQSSWSIYLDADKSDYATLVTSGVENQILARNAVGQPITTGAVLITNATQTSQAQATNFQFVAALGVEDRIQASLVNPNRLSGVLDVVTAPPSNPIVGEAYLINGTGSGAFFGQNNKIAKFNNSKVDGGTTPWTFITPASTNKVAVSTGTYAGNTFVFNGSTWDLESPGNPTGAILAFYGTTIPTGYLLCDGATFDAGTYAALNTFLSGNTLPDLRGVFLRGKNGARSTTTGNSGGDKAIGTYEADAYASHAHNASNGTIGANAFGDGHSGAVFNTSYGVQSGRLNWNTSSSGSGTETRPRNVTVNYIIKT